MSECASLLQTDLWEINFQIHQLLTKLFLFKQKIFKNYTLDRGNVGGLVHLTHTSRKVLCFVLQAEIPALAELCNRQMLLPQLCALRQCTNIDVLSLGNLPSLCV